MKARMRAYWQTEHGVRKPLLARCFATTTTAITEIVYGLLQTVKKYASRLHIASSQSTKSGIGSPMDADYSTDF